MSKADDLILGICDAYEQGFGMGIVVRKLNNPYKIDTMEYKAWEYGYLTGTIKYERNKGRKV